ncbi:MAG: hypothetical protein J5744_00565 [Oscillospiraceae bacterium]|nr:hypothetical protein [Oscillospiraceae bacterium]
MNNGRLQAKERRTNKKRDGFSPFQKFVMFLSITLILATITVSAMYLVKRNGGIDLPIIEKLKGSNKEKEPEPVPVEEEEWDGFSLKKTDDAGQKYVDDTLFIGDSNFRRMYIYKLLPLKSVIGMTGKGIQDALYSKEVYLSGYKDPVSVATAVQKIEPRRVLLCFGTNNLTGDVDSFISVYRDTVDAIRKAYEYTDVIVMSIPALASDVSTEYGWLTMEAVDTFNAALKEMCVDMDVPFLNVTDGCLKDPETGYAREGIMYSDGIHLEEPGLRDVLDYYRTHAYITDDRRSSNGSGIYVVDEPAKAELIDCDKVQAAVITKLVSDGYTMASTSEDKKGIESKYTYTIDASAEKDSQDKWTSSIYNYIKSYCLKTSKLAITWYDISSGAHVFEITEYQKCAEGKHTVKDWKIEKEATCSAEGQKKGTCEVCGEEVTEKIPKDPNNHTYAWKTLVDATCTYTGEEEGICSGCGAKTTREIPAKGHDPIVTQEGVDAGCETSGWTREVKCSVCGEILEERDEIPELGHDYEATIEVEPTETEYGAHRYTCSRCGDSFLEYDIPPVEPSEPSSEPEE